MEKVWRLQLSSSVEAGTYDGFSHGSNQEAAIGPEEGLGYNLRPSPSGLCPQLLKPVPSLLKPSAQGMNLWDISYSRHNSTSLESLR